MLKEVIAVCDRNSVDEYVCVCVCVVEVDSMVVWPEANPFI